LENRYPVILNKFCLRNGSGGHGTFNGGDGLIREYFFREPMNLCVLTERRVFQPYGLFGGASGARGKNTVKKRDGRLINLCSKSQIDIEPGVRFLLFIN
jgi:5-oxoprolinase (ATP-hydrolysing)